MPILKSPSYEAWQLIFSIVRINCEIDLYFFGDSEVAIYKMVIKFSKMLVFYMKNHVRTHLHLQFLVSFFCIRE
jgi:hypothetical protein